MARKRLRPGELIARATNFGFCQVLFANILYIIFKLPSRRIIYYILYYILSACITTYANFAHTEFSRARKFDTHVKFSKQLQKLHELRKLRRLRTSVRQNANFKELQKLQKLGQILLKFDSCKSWNL